MEEEKYYILTNYRIPEKCIDQYEKDIKINKLLGKGKFGSVFEVCKEDYDCNYVLKIVPIIKFTDYKTEIKYTVIASKIEIGPKIYSSWMCDNVSTLDKKEMKMGFILMERMYYTLAMYISKYRELFIKNSKLLKEMYKELLTKMLKAKIINDDLHFNNIMINTNEKLDPIKMRIIDWGMGKSTDDGKYDIDELLDDWDVKAKLLLEEDSYQN